MSLLRQFLKLLQLIETFQEAIEFLLHPMGISGAVGSCLYLCLQSLAEDSSTAAALACTTALATYCLAADPKDF